MSLSAYMVELGVIFNLLKIYNMGITLGAVKSFSLVGFHQAWVRLGSHL